MDPKPLHYLADWVAHFTYDSKDWSEVQNIPTFRGWFEDGFNQLDNNELRQLLRCHRRWAQTARVIAARDCASVGASASPSPFELNSRLKVKAARWIEDLSPKEIITLFHVEDPM
jgi:hypothetical protein